VVCRAGDLYDPRPGAYLERQRPRGAEERRHRRKSAFRYRYDTPGELALLNELWGYVNLRKNLFMPTKKAIRWRTTKVGRNTRTYDKPRTPYRRLLDSSVLSPEQTDRLARSTPRPTPPS